MEQIKRDAALETTQDNAEQKDNDVRTLKDLEMVLVGGGGDGQVTW
jgi:hypothetical protein